MCHGHAIAAFPAATEAEIYTDIVSGYLWKKAETNHRIAILPDIYGCNPQYKGLATRFHNMGAEVYLIDTFAEFGDLHEMTRELAFERRHKVKDTAFINRFEEFLNRKNITGVVGFCLGGLYVFELARRNVDATLIGLYGFPQGMPNQDPLPIPFDYLPSVTKRHTMLLGYNDPVIGEDNIDRLSNMAPDLSCLNLKVYNGVGHNFLALLDSENTAEVAIAKDALEICDTELFS